MSKSPGGCFRGTIVPIAGDALRLASFAFRSRTRLAAENLFLRKQLALYVERQVKPRRADDPTRITLVILSRLVDWRALTVRPAGDADSVASEGIPVVLALQIETSGTTAVTGRLAPADWRHALPIARGARSGSRRNSS